MSDPRFIDNRDGNTFTKNILTHLKALRDKGESPDELCIATGYFNALGWIRVATEAERIGKVRLLIGAEPSARTEIGVRRPGDPREPERTKQQVHQALGEQVRILKQERDKSFEFRADVIGQLGSLVKFFRSETVEVRRYEKRFFHAKAWLLRGNSRGVVAGSSNLTAAGMAGNLELNLGHYEASTLDKVEKWYDEVWEEASPFDLAELYELLFEKFSPWLIYLRVLWELYGDQVEEEQEATGDLLLTRFQRHGGWRARRIIDEFGGVIIADGVGLGKTFVAGGLMEIYKNRRQRILLIRPAALAGAWDNFLSANFLGDVEAISFQKLAGDIQLIGTQHHLKRPIDEYQLVVIDEAHNYRNPDAPTRAGVLRQFMRGPRRDLILLTATPVNNSLYDLYHLISFFLQDARLIKHGIPSIKGLFDEANRIAPGHLNPDLLYPLIDATTVKRTRQFVKKHYQDDRIPGPDGVLMPITFPQPIPKTVRYDLDGVLPGFFAQFSEALMPETGQPKLSLARYQVERYLLDPDDDAGPETAFVGLLRSGLLKRFESSAHAFSNTCKKMVHQHRLLLQAMDSGHVISGDFYKEFGASEDFDDEEFLEAINDSGRSQPLHLYDSDKLRENVEHDLELLNEFAEQTAIIQPRHDPKLHALIEELADITSQAEKDSVSEEEHRDNRKVLIFSYYKDTAIWILNWLQKAIEDDDRLIHFRGRLAATSGSPGNDHHLLDADIASWGFAPRTAASDSFQAEDKFDVLITTDVLAEGVNLQQCRNIINYDMPWNPMRLVQRHGRIDRLLSRHKRVFLRTFFPDTELDSILDLESRVRQKMALAAASVGLAEAPIEHGAQADLSFTEARQEIEKIETEETEIFEKGGTKSAAQTGEEYRQELRKALVRNLKEVITEIPWKAGSGFIKSDSAGHFFCAKVGEQTFLRFVPDGASSDKDVIKEIGTCLRKIECTEETERFFPDSPAEADYRAWELARENIWKSWDFFTDPKNLQPKVRKLNREVDAFLIENPPANVDQARIDNVSEILMSPWPMREENKLRIVWKEEHQNSQERALALIQSVEATGIEPFEQPARHPKIEHHEVRLVCWLAIQASAASFSLTSVPKL